MAAHTFKMYSEKNKKLIVIDGYKFYFQKFLNNNLQRWACTKRMCKSYLKLNDNSEIIFSATVHDHEKDEENLLNRQKISNNLKRSFLDDQYVNPSKIVHRELQKEGDVLPIENVQQQSKEKQSESEIKYPTPRKTEKRKTQSHISTSKNKKTTHDQEINFMILNDAIEKLQEISNRASQVNFNREDSFDYFGKYIASMLRGIQQPIAMRLQQNIIDMIANVICQPQEVFYNHASPEHLTSDNSISAKSERQSNLSTYSASNNEDDMKLITDLN